MVANSGISFVLTSTDTGATTTPRAWSRAQSEEPGGSVAGPGRLLGSGVVQGVQHRSGAGEPQPRRAGRDQGPGGRSGADAAGRLDAQPPGPGARPARRGWGSPAPLR